MRLRAVRTSGCRVHRSRCSADNEAIRRDLRPEIEKTCVPLARKNNQHRRTPDVIANLQLGPCSLEFASSVGAITDAERQELWTEAWAALGEAAEAQQSITP